MRFGAPSVQLTSVLAKGLRRPKVRSDLTFSEQIMQGEVSYVVKVPETDAYARYTAYSFELLNLCDGTRTSAEVSEAMNERQPDQQVSEQDVMDFIEGVDPYTWERTLGEKNLAVLERIRDERKHRAEGSTLLQFTVSAWESDKVLARVYPYVRWFFTRTFMILSAALFVLTFIIVAGDYPRIRQNTVEFYTFSHKSAYDLWVFWILVFIISGVHEFGHGLTCKHFGGEVPRMGLLSIYFTPAFFTDCSGMCMFEKTSERLWTIFAGIWVELTVCGISTLIWYFAPPGSFVGDLGYKMLLLTGVSGVFFNLNPLMKFDGYYALCQYTECDNLREDSFEYLKAFLQRYVLRRDVEVPPASRRRRRLFLIYSIAVTAYSTMVLLLLAKFVKNVFTSKFGDFLGYILTAVVVYLLMRKRLRKWSPAWFSGLRSAKEKFMAWKMTRSQQLGGLAALLLIVAVPTAVKVDSELVLEPGARAEVRAPVAGLVTEVPVHEGDRVETGAVLARLRNPSLEAHAAVAQRELEQSQGRLFAAIARNDYEEAAKQTRETQRWQTELAVARSKAANLVLRAPHGGEVATPQVEQKVGSYLGEGETFAVLADRGTMKARVLVRDIDLEEIQPGALVKLKVRARPLTTFSGQVEQIMPAAALDQPVVESQKIVRFGQALNNYFAVVVRIPNPNGELREGMTGIAKIYGHRYPLVWRAGRSIWRWGRGFIW